MWYSQYGPIICFAVVLAVLLLLWVFWSSPDNEFVGLAPLNPETCDAYTGSPYEWGKSNSGGELGEGEFCEGELGEGEFEEGDLEEGEFEEGEFEEGELGESNSEEVILEENEFDYYENVCPSEMDPEVRFSEAEPEATEVCYSIHQAPIAATPFKSGRFISKGERICCDTMQKVYGVPFTTKRPSWLQNPETKRNLELDCYNEDLKLAVEYNGVQHYEWPNYTGQSQREFENQVRRDHFKKRMCDRRGVYLITVPHTVPHDDIPAYIINRLPETLRQRLSQEQLHNSVI
jgi:hypothetical protein